MSIYLLIGLVGILALGVSAQWLAWRLKLPAILLLLIFGIIAGPVANLINPDQLFGEILGPIVSVSVAIILFEGGLSLRFSELRDIGGTVGRLISIGVIVTWVMTAFFAYQLLDLGLELSILLGAILTVTGPTVILPLLRHVRPAGKVGSILKWEGITIDPIGAMLSVLVFEIIIAGGIGQHISSSLLSIWNTVFFGTVLGLLGAAIIYYMLKKHLMPDFLQNPISLTLVVVVFAASNYLQHESGLWAVTVMGMGLANQKSVRVKHIIEFKENLRVLLISALFIMLSARLEISHLAHFDVYSIAFLAALVLVVRPASTFLSTIGAPLNIKERIFLSWMAPRGIVAAAISSIFALYLADQGYVQAELLVPYTFLVIIGTVTIYGLTSSFLAMKLKLAKPVPRGVLILGAHEWSRKLACKIHNYGIKIIMADSNYHHIEKASQDGLATYHGNVLSEYALEEVDLDGIGHLMAITPNDEVNSLAAIRFADYFGRSEVYQLAPLAHSMKREKEVPEFLSGRVLFKQQLNYSEVNRIIQKGGEIGDVEITETFDFDSYQEKWSSSAVPLLAITPEQELKVFAIDNNPEPNEGDIIIHLIVPESMRDQLKQEEDEASA